MTTMHTAGGLLTAWTRLGIAGVLAFLLAYLLGAVPGLPSPIIKITDAQADVTRAVLAHDHTTREGQRLLRLVCRGVWQGNPEMQGQCE